MSDRALEFVETWVEEKIEEMGEPPGDIETEAKALATQCIAAAQSEEITQSDIEAVFDDLAAFIAGEIEEAIERNNRSDDDASLVAEDDARLDDHKDDEDA